MPSEIIVVNHHSLTENSRWDHLFTPGVEEALALARNANTERAYKRWGRMATVWCNAQNRTSLPMPTRTLTGFVHWLTTLEARSPQGKPLGRPYAKSSLDQAVAAILTAHDRSEQPKPSTKQARDLIKAHAKRMAAKGRRKKQSLAITLPVLRSLLAGCDLNTMRGRRDALILAMGYGMMGRRSEVTDLMIQHTGLDGAWVQTWLPYSKTDKDAEGEDIEIPALLGRGVDLGELVISVKADLSAQGIEEGGLIRALDRWGVYLDPLHPGSVNDIVKALGEEAGIEGVTAHGLRAGGPTDAADRGVPASVIARHGRWAETSTQVMTYVRPASKRKNHPLLGG